MKKKPKKTNTKNAKTENYLSDTKTTTHHQHTNAQIVTEKQLFWKNNSILLLSTILYGLGQLSWGCASSQLLVHL